MAQSAKYRHRNQSYRQALSSITEETMNPGELIIIQPPDPIDADDFESIEDNSKKMGSMLSTLNLMCAKIKQLDDQVNHEHLGLNPRLLTAQEQADTTSKEVEDLKNENKILKGVLQKQSKQIQTLNDRVTQLAAKSMERNLIITGILGDEKKENCKVKVQNFFKNIVEIDCNLEEIYVAHRKGFPSEGYNRPMLVRCSYGLKERVMKNITSFKDKTNDEGEKYYVNKQLPGVLAEHEKEIRETIRDQKV